MNEPVNQRNRFLVIQQKMVGDVLSSTVICEALKEVFPDCHVSYVANESTLAVLENNPFIDRIIVFEKTFDRDTGKFLGFLRKLRQFRYDAVIDAYGKLQSNLMSLFARSPCKIAYEKGYSRIIYHHNLERIRDQRTDIATAIRARLKLLQPLLSGCEAPVIFPRLHVTESERSEASHSLTQAGLDTSRPILMVTALGSSEFKTYPLNYLAEVLDYIADSCPEIQLVYNYLPRQKDRIDELYEHCREDTRLKTFPDFYADSLRSFIAVVSCCQGVLGNEGGGINIGKALEIPTFSLFNPSITKKAWHSDSRADQFGIHLRDYQPELFNGKGLAEIQRANAELYSAFKPAHFQEELRKYCSTYLCVQ